MENSNNDLSKGIVNFNKEEMKIYNFLICLSTSCKEHVPFSIVKKALRIYRMDVLYMSIINKNFILINKDNMSQWNPSNVITADLVYKIYASYLIEKKSQSKLRKANRIEASKIPANLIPIDKILKQPPYVKKNTHGVREATIAKYVRFMEILAENKTTSTGDVQALVKNMHLTAEMKTVLNELGLIITDRREIMWDDTIAISDELAINIGLYINAKTMKKPLPIFDINKYKKDTNQISPKWTAIIKSAETSNTPKIDAKHNTVVNQPTAIEVKPEVTTQATVQHGDSASINLLLAQEIIAKGGDKQLALKLMRNEI